MSILVFLQLFVVELSETLAFVSEEIETCSRLAVDGKICKPEDVCIFIIELEVLNIDD